MRKIALPVESERRSSQLGAYTRDDLEAARSRVARIIEPSPILETTFGKNGKILLKTENDIPTGSFKIRGAANFLHKWILDKGPGDKKICSASTGNHGRALAWLAQEYGLRVTIVVPSGTPSRTIKTLLDLQAEVIESGSSINESLAIARRISSEKNYRFVPNFHPDIAAGHASLGIEIFEQSRPDVVLFPIGIGSGISGISLARNFYGGDCHVLGIVASNCPAWKHSFEKGFPVSSSGDTIASGIRISQPDLEVFKFLKSNIKDVIAVSEVEILRAQESLVESEGIRVDSTGAVGLAGAMKYDAARQHNETIVTLTCGSFTQSKQETSY